MFELQVSLTTSLLLKLAYKYFAVKLDINDAELAMIVVNTVRRIPGGAGGNCGGLYTFNGELRHVSIKLLHQASDVGLVDVLAHEMVHAAQHLRGEFTFSTRKNKVLWGLLTIKEKIKIHKGQILNDTLYFDRLCEQEAFTRSREMTREFLNFINILETKDVDINRERESEAGSRESDSCEALGYIVQSWNDPLPVQ